MDIDIQILAEDGPAADAATFLGAVVEGRAREEVFDQESVILHFPTHPVAIELFLGSHWYPRQALERHGWVESRSLGRVPIPAVEDFILLKAAHHESPSRSRMKRASDGVDIESVIERNQGRLDLAYLEENASRLEVWGFLRPLVEEHGP